MKSVSDYRKRDILFEAAKVTILDQDLTLCVLWASAVKKEINRG
jgi:hypothetical protein